MVSLTMIGSIILGVVSLVLPIYSLNKDARYKGKYIRLSVGSLIACSISLYLQICYLNHLIKIEDISALFDTGGTSNLFSLALLIGTLGLNLVNLFKYKN